MKEAKQTIVIVIFRKS